MLSLLVYLLFFLVICYVVWWAIGAMSLPQPVRVIAVVIMAVIALLFLLQVMPLGAHVGPLLR